MPRKRRSQAVQTPTGMPYGVAGKLQEAQRQMPLAAPQGPAPGAGSSPMSPAPGADPFAAAKNTPPPSGGLARPSDRPGEPLTAGLPMGPGAGPEAMALPAFPEDTDVELDLQRAYQLNPSVELARLIELVRNRNAQRQTALNAGRRRQQQIGRRY